MSRRATKLYQFRPRADHHTCYNRSAGPGRRQRGDGTWAGRYRQQRVSLRHACRHHPSHWKIQHTSITTAKRLEPRCDVLSLVLAVHLTIVVNLYPQFN